MIAHELLIICILAFFWVFAVLSLLAIMMRIMTSVFPKQDSPGDLPLYMAITAAIGQIMPGTNVTKIEEIK